MYNTIESVKYYSGYDPEPRSGKEYYTPKIEKLISRAVFFWPQNPFIGSKMKGEPTEEVPANNFLLAGTGSGK